MGNFYTGKGDKGKSYVGKKSVSKTCLEIEALGQLDELNSMIGVLKSQKILRELQKVLHQVQEDLFIVQSNIAQLMLSAKRKTQNAKQNFKVPELRNSKIKKLETIIDKIEYGLPPLKKFVISGSNQTSAWLDFLRAKSRNVERSVLKIKKAELIDSNIRAYLNRLSSLFFALARWEAKKEKEKNPKYQ